MVVPNPMYALNTCGADRQTMPPDGAAVTAAPTVEGMKAVPDEMYQAFAPAAFVITPN
jgi:hypothetical protein